MFRNIILRGMVISAQVRNTGGVAGITKTIATKDDRREEKDADIEAALKIEASLFENSSLQHRPDLLRNQKQSKATLNPQKLAKRQQTPPLRQPKVIDDPELGLQFMRLNLNDPILGTLMTTVRSRKRRDKQRQIIVEGRRLIREALDCNLRMHSLIFSQIEQLRQIKEQVAHAQHTTQSQVYQVAQHDLKTWSTLTTPSGLLGIFERPPAEGIVQGLSSTKAAPITVVCDNIREPNNLGSIIRTCAAIPCLQVIVTRGCCDPWESKALRGGCGGQFRLPIRDDVDWTQLNSSSSVFIPPEAMDDCCIFIAENNTTKAAGSYTQTVDYAELGRTGAHNVVIIGGESHGVSKEAYKFMETAGSRGKCLHIPLAAGVDSLNVTSALTLILYELRRHCIQKPDAETTPTL